MKPKGPRKSKTKNDREAPRPSQKFATQLDEKVLQDLKSFVAQTDRTISSVVSEAVAEFVHRNRLRPAFRNAMDEVLDDHTELLQRLAK